MKKFCALLLSAAILFSFNGCALFMGGEIFEDGGDVPFTEYNPENIYNPTNNYTPETDVPDENTTLYPGVYHGEVYMTDGGTYYMKDSDTVDVLIPNLPEGVTFTSAWYGTGNVSAVGLTNSNKCNVLAVLGGEGTVGVYYSILQGNEWKDYHCEMKIVIESTWPTFPAQTENYDNDYNNDYNYNYNDWGNDALDVCDNCYGTGKMPCPTCDGEGNLGPPSYNPCPSSYCSYGYVPCPCY